MWGPAVHAGEHLDDGLILPEGRFGWSLSIVGTALGAYALEESTPWSIAIGVVIQLLGGALMIACLRVYGEGGYLVTEGPYRWVRHPFYAGVLLLLLGAIVALRAWPALILYVVAVRLTVRRARIEEHNMRIEFGTPYDTYAERVPFLLPLAPPLPRGGMTAEQRSRGGVPDMLIADGAEEAYRDHPAAPPPEKP